MNRSFLCSILYFVDRGKAETDALILNGGFLMDYNNYDRGYAEPSMSASDYMTRTYRWMAGGLLVTFAMAYITATTPLIYLVDSLYFLLTIGELALVFMLSARVQKMSIDGARAAFFGYAILNGMVLSYYFLMFSVGTLVMAFLATAVYFGLMAVYGTTTHKDLTGWGPRLMMALVAMIVTSLVGALFGFGFGASVLYCGLDLLSLLPGEPAPALASFPRAGGDPPHRPLQLRLLFQSGIGVVCLIDTLFRTGEFTLDQIVQQRLRGLPDRKSVV